ncbi:sensor domain-containing diguanylate cyclase [Sporomusa sp. KB1]|jgi:diguanylate cyclase (GGDEF)-like protein|uniref:sensor domain-containing diguanylate cyclase n=1 Tax=Sporomusa sp. KB1 TaxID=943346 RepID=UPI00119DC1A6|nr:sensor domain-containing diguanylate cyclase [Sporomusa sp. KB1]TWH46906.1 diguanylate cyclase (GGDEF)-like protein [Sporomusa sp. KB1]
MLKIGTTGKYIKYLVVAAILLPLIFIAEIAYVERQQTQDSSQVQIKNLINRRAEAENAWLSSQAAYVRGIAKLSARTVDEPEIVNNEFRSFLTAEFRALGYAGNDGRIKVDTSGSSGRDISSRSFFAEAIAGREFTGRVSGADWQLDEEVIVVAVPVTASGAVIGVIYGVIPQETITAVIEKLVPAGGGEQQEIGRWLAWLGGVYFLGVIPLLLLVYLLRHHQPVASNKRSIGKAPVNRPRPSRAGDQEPAAIRKKFADATAVETPETIAVRKITEIIAADRAEPIPATKEKPVEATTVETAAVKKIAEINAAEIVEAAPAAMIDRVRAVAAYKGTGRESATKKVPVISQEPEKIAVPVSELEPKPEVERRSMPAVSLKAIPSEGQEPVPELTPNLPAIDDLTGLYTQAAFEKKIAAQQEQPDSAIIVLSIDGMKVINDFLGNLAGDTLINVAADILKTVAGPACTAARIDGDRFAALLTNVSTEVFEDFKKDIKYYIDLHNLRQPELPLSITTGVAAAKQGESLTSVWERADRDMETRKAINRVEARKFIMMSIKRQRQKP